MKEFKRVKASKRSLSRRSKVLGVGVNDAWYMVVSKVNGKNVNCPSYSAWKNMLARCYFDDYKSRNPTYHGCSVCDEWLLFSNFDKWYIQNYIDGYHLDKDIKCVGNKEYHPDRCIYIPPEINNLIITSNSGNGTLPAGISINNSKNKKYKVRMRTRGERVTIGCFKTLKQATYAYCKEKNDEIKRKCKEYPSIKKYLINHMIKIEVES